LKSRKVFTIFFREKPAMMLVKLRAATSEIYASSLAKQVDCTYSHVVKILQEMEKAKIVSFKKEGRLKILELTEKGKQLADHVAAIIAKL